MSRLPAIGPTATVLGLVLAACGCCGLVCSQAAGPDAPTGPDAVVVSLKATAVVPAGEVRVADVADLAGGDEQLRSQIGALDLAEAPAAGETIRLTKNQFAYRMRIAGIESAAFRLAGAAESAVSLRGHFLTEDAFLAEAKICLADRLQCDQSDLSVQLLRPLRFSALLPDDDGLPDDDELRLEACLRSSRMPTGRVRMELAVLAGERRVGVTPVELDVRLFQQVAVATRRIERGESLTKDNLRFDRRDVNGLATWLTPDDSPVGKVAKRSLGQRQVIAAGDVEAPPRGDDPVLVKQREAVQLVARVGSLRVTAAGEALQNGRAGQMIRVRNVDSKSVVQGRVAGRNVVEVVY